MNAILVVEVVIASGIMAMISAIHDKLINGATSYDIVSVSYKFNVHHIAMASI